MAWADPDIQIVDVDLVGDRRLMLEHRANNQIPLDENDARSVLQHLADLWGYEVVLEEVDGANGARLKKHVVGPRRPVGGP